MRQTSNRDNHEPVGPLSPFLLISDDVDNFSRHLAASAFKRPVIYHDIATSPKPNCIPKFRWEFRQDGLVLDSLEGIEVVSSGLDHSANGVSLFQFIGRR